MRFILFASLLAGTLTEKEVYGTRILFLHHVNEFIKVKGLFN